MTLALVAAALTACAHPGSSSGDSSPAPEQGPLTGPHRIPIRASASRPVVERGRGRVEHEAHLQHARRRRSSSASRTPISRSPASTRFRAATTASRSGTSPTRTSRRSRPRTSAPHRRATSRSTRTCCSFRRKADGRLDCGAEGVKDTVSTERLRGIRIFDITDIAHPKNIAQRADVPRLAHAHAARRSQGHGQRLHLHLRARPACARRASSPDASSAMPDQDPNSALFRIEVIKVPLAHPEQAAIVSSPRIFNDLGAPPTHGEPRPADNAKIAEAKRARAHSSPTSWASEMVLPPQFVEPHARQYRQGARRHGCADRRRQRHTARCDSWHDRQDDRRGRIRTGEARSDAVPRHHRLSGDRVGRRRMRRLRTAARHQRSGAPGSHRCGIRLEFLLLALRHVQQRRHQGAVLR